MTINTSQTVLKTERPQAPFLIFDIETVPDIPLLYMNYKDELSLQVAFEESIHWNNFSIYEQIKKQTKIEFPKTLYHSVLSICALYIDPNTYYIMDGFKRTIPKTNSYEEFLSYEKKILEELQLNFVHPNIVEF